MGSQQARKRALGSFAAANAGYTEARILMMSAESIGDREPKAKIEEPEVMDFEIQEAEALAAGYDRQGNPVGIWDCGATMSAGSAQLLQPVFEEVFDGNVGLKESFGELHLCRRRTIRGAVLLRLTAVSALG